MIDLNEFNSIENIIENPGEPEKGSAKNRIKESVKERAQESLKESETFCLPPDLSALEARLGQFLPRLDEKKCQKLQMALLREQCRLLEEKNTPALRREYLVETFKMAEKEEVSLSLNQFLKSVRISSALVGGGIGFLLGTLITFAGIYLTVHFLSPEMKDVKQPIETNTFYEFRSHRNDPFFFPGQNSLNTFSSERELTHENQ